MQEKIFQIIQSIEAEDALLIGKIDTDFKAISSFSGIKTVEALNREDKGKSSLPRVLYVASAILGAGAMVTKLVSHRKQIEQESEAKEGSNNLTIGLSIASLSSAVGGFLCSRQKQTKVSSSSTLENIDLTSLKNNVTSESIVVVKSITKKWEEFMEGIQQEMFSFIDSSTQSTNQKDELTSKIFTYEVIDVNLSELMTLINASSSISEIVKNLDLFRSKLISATKNAAERQIEKYTSLL